MLHMTMLISKSHPNSPWTGYYLVEAPDRFMAKVAALHYVTERLSPIGEPTQVKVSHVIDPILHGSNLGREHFHYITFDGVFGTNQDREGTIPLTAYLPADAHARITAHMERRGNTFSNWLYAMSLTMDRNQVELIDKQEPTREERMIAEVETLFSVYAKALYRLGLSDYDIHSYLNIVLDEAAEEVQRG